VTAQIVNLRMARKQRERAAKQTRAAANREKFGRSKAERAKREAAGEQEAAYLDGHWIGPRLDARDDDVEQDPS